ncbi:MAG: hypothetical protein ACLRPW_01445 [Intestinibacter sp.]
MKKREAFAKLPSVDSILSNNNIKNLLDNYPRELILESIRDVIESKRQEIIRIKEDEVETFDIEEDILIDDIIQSTKNKFQLSKKVINATGIVILI